MARSRKSNRMSIRQSVQEYLGKSAISTEALNDTRLSWAQRIALELVQGAAKPDLKMIDVVLGLIGEIPDKKAPPAQEQRPVRALDLSGLSDEVLELLAEREE